MKVVQTFDLPEKKLTLILYCVVCGDEWRDLSSDIGSVDLSSSADFIILNHMYLVNIVLIIIRLL